MNIPSVQRRPTGIVLFGHGSRDPQWAAPMLRVEAVLRAGEPQLQVRLAFLEFLTPTLAEAIDELAELCGSVVVVPMFMAQAGHLKRDLPQLLDIARMRHTDLQLRIAAPIGEAESVIVAIAAYATAEARS